MKVEIRPTKEPEGHVDDPEAAEPTLTEKGSIGDTHIPPTQFHPSSKKRIKPKLFSQMKMRLIWRSGWLTTH